jgi:hypothetical protein
VLYPLSALSVPSTNAIRSSARIKFLFRRAVISFSIRPVGVELIVRQDHFRIVTSVGAGLNDKMPNRSPGEAGAVKGGAEMEATL